MLHFICSLFVFASSKQIYRAFAGPCVGRGAELGGVGWGFKRDLFHFKLALWKLASGDMAWHRHRGRRAEALSCGGW
jgi:hypothetical protein